MKRAIVYIDGFNFYFGVFYKNAKSLQWKWIDYVKLGQVLLKDCTLVKVKWFTAPVNGKMDAQAPQRQRDHWNASKIVNGDKLDIIKGVFRVDPKRFPIAKHQCNDRTNEGTKDRIWVIKTEEKGSDVNLAVHMVNDAFRDLYDTALVMSNDSDLLEAIKIVSQDLGKEVILLNPHEYRDRKSRQAKELFDLRLKQVHLRDTHLLTCQLPEEVTDKETGKTFRRPIEWK